jgi:uncharacterized delta-60 repeat protein
MSKFCRCLCIMYVLTLPSFIFGQEWAARYNGPGDSTDGAWAIVLDGDGNIYVTGESHGSGTGPDYATVKYNPSGVEQWVARYDNYNDDARAIAIDGMNNIYVTGQSFGSGTYDDYATVKYDPSGTEQWVARYNGTSNYVDEATAIAVDNSGNVHVTGHSYGAGTSGDYATVKYNTSGVEQWVARYNGPGDDTDFARAIAVDDASNVYVAGLSYGVGSSTDYATVKYNSSGVEQWVVRYNGPGNLYDSATDLTLDNAGNVYVTGGSTGSGTNNDYATVKYNSSGVEQWVARYNGLGNASDGACAITIDPVGNIYVTGQSYGSGTDFDCATVKYDSMGVEQWVARYNGPDNDDDIAYAIALDNSANVYITGESYGLGTYRDYVTVKYNSMGVEQWVVRYNGTGNQYDYANAIAVDNTGNVYITGFSYGSGTNYDYATIKYTPTGIEENILTVRKRNEITPIIFRGFLQLPEGKECRVFDITGRVVAPDKIQPGIYFIEVDGLVTQKVVKVR